jgi:hypothetical protein
MFDPVDIAASWVDEAVKARAKSSGNEEKARARCFRCERHVR